jgi:putative thioredoxin
MAEARATTPNIFDTTAERFMSDVVERSKRQAVAVDFWAPWCGPCRALTPLLEQLVTHYAGGLAVARVNTDAEPAIASQFGIRSIPDVRIFRDGRMVDGFVGVQPLGRLQALFDRYVLPPSDGSREEAERLLESGDAQQAVARLRQLLTKDPSNAALSINLADALVRDGKLEEAEQLLANLPANAGASKEADAVRARLQLTRDAATAQELDTLRRASERPDAPLGDFYRLAAHEILRGDAGLGLELLLTILRRDRRFQDGLAQRALLQAFALLGDDDEHVAQTRRKMAALLY